MAQCDTGLDVVFYDRRNNREVRASQLVPAKGGTCTYGIDPHSLPATFEELNARTMTVVDGGGNETEMPWNHFHYINVSDVGYRTEECPKGQNFDREALIHELVFLRFEHLPGEEARYSEKLELEKEINRLRGLLDKIRENPLKPDLVHDLAYEALTGRKC